MSQVVVRRGFGGALIVLWLLPGATTAQESNTVPFEFSLVEVESPWGGPSYMTDLDNLGRVVGSAIGPHPSSERVYCNLAVVWSDGEVLDIGTPLGACSHANAISDDGRIVGSYDDVNNRHRVFFLDLGADVETPDPFAGDLSPNDINNAQQWVGDKRPSGGGEWTAFLMNGETPVDLHPGDAVSSSAVAINSEGVVVGWVDLGALGTRAVVWSEGGPTRIGDAGEHFSAVALNDFSQIVVLEKLPGGASTRSYVMDGEAIVELDVFGSSVVAARDINNLGWVVGEYSSPEGSEMPFWRHAFLAAEGETHDLNDLVGNDAGWDLWYSIAINDAAQILASGLNLETGFGGYVLLTPKTSENLIDDLIVDVRELIDDGVINYGRGRSLIAELQVALWFLEFKGGERIAVIRIELFILKVERLVRNADLDAEIGAELIEKAEAILEMLQAP